LKENKKKTKAVYDPRVFKGRPTVTKKKRSRERAPQANVSARGKRSQKKAKGGGEKRTRAVRRRRISRRRKSLRLTKRKGNQGKTPVTVSLPQGKREQIGF